MKKLFIACSFVFIFFTAFVHAQVQVWEVPVAKTDILLRGASVVLAQQSISLKEAGKVVVHFDGQCSSTAGDRIILAASNTPDWGVNDGAVGTEATANCRTKPFSHTRVYEVTARTQTFYAVAENYVEESGSGNASIYGTLTVEFFPASGKDQVYGVSIIKSSYNLRSASKIIASQVVKTTSPSSVIVSFDGQVISTPGDLVVLAASKSSSWEVNDGNTGVKATDASVNRNSFSHTRIYNVESGINATFNAIADNYVEQEGDGIASIYATLVVKVYSLEGATKVASKSVASTNINVRGSAVTVAKQDITAPSKGWAMVRFDGTVYSTPGDLLVLAASNTSNWTSNDGNVSLSAENSQVNQASFSHSRLYQVAKGTATFYAVVQNYVNVSGTGIASIYGSLTVEFIPDEIPFLADLLFSSVKVSSATVFNGDSIEAGVSIVNSGRLACKVASNMRVFLSENNTYESADILLGDSAVISLLNAGAVQNFSSLHYQIPAGTLPGNYYLLFVADADKQIDELEETNNLVAVPLKINTHPVISMVSPPSSLPLNTLVKLNIKISSINPLASVSFTYTKISAPDSTKSIALTGASPFAASVPAAFFNDLLGVEFTVTATDNAGFTNTFKGAVRVLWPAPGLKIPYNNYGAKQQNYRIIAFPFQLESNAISDVFQSSLGVYNQRQWRLLSYVNGTNVEYTNGLNKLDAGKGYWFIVKDTLQKAIYSGAGSSVAATYEHPYFVPLVKGWNQIGNPYNFNMSWNDIKSYVKNNASNLISWKKWEGSWTGNDILNSFEGGFVLAKQADTLYFPVKRNLSIKRLGLEAYEHMRSNHWSLPLSLSSEEGVYTLGGIGMNEEALSSMDALDDFTPPRFGDWMEINFEHPEYFYPKFTSDIVPYQTEHVWDFTVESWKEGMKRLSWDTAYPSEANKERNGNSKFILYDLEADQITDMGKQGAYRFESSQARKFKIFYGSPSFIESYLSPGTLSLSAVHPNPAERNTAGTFSLPSAALPYQIDLGIYNTLGQKVHTLASGSYTGGFYKFTWDIANTLPEGLYVLKLHVFNGSNQMSLSRKILRAVSQD